VDPEPVGDVSHGICRGCYVEQEARQDAEEGARYCGAGLDAKDYEAAEESFSMDATTRQEGRTMKSRIQSIAQRARIAECIECTVQLLNRDGTVYPGAYDSCDDYVDAVFEFAASRWGPFDAASKSALRRWLRGDWDRYVAEVAAEEI
jgi:hypothetical protein